MYDTNKVKEHFPLISIITVNYNQLKVTCELLDSIRQISYKNVEVIVVDNASKKDPGSVIETQYPEVHYIRSEKNLGFSGGNNLGIAASSGEFLLFINNDAELTEGALESMIALFDRVPDLGALSPLICYENENPGKDKDLIQYAGSTPVHSLTARNKTLGELEPDNGQYTEAFPTAYTHGAAMMVSRKVIDTVGVWPEEFFLYYEELDWCDQIRRAGFSIYCEPNAKVYHKESVSVGRLSTLKTYYINRNRILYMRRNKSKLQLTAFIIFLVLFTIPKNTLLFLIKGEFAHLNVFWSAIVWNLVGYKGGASYKAPKKRAQLQRVS